MRKNFSVKFKPKNYIIRNLVFHKKNEEMRKKKLIT